MEGRHRNTNTVGARACVGGCNDQSCFLLTVLHHTYTCMLPPSRHPSFLPLSRSEENSHEAPSQAICFGWALTVMHETVCCRNAGGGAPRAEDAGAEAGALARRARGEHAGDRGVKCVARALGVCLRCRPAPIVAAGASGPPREGCLGVEGGGRSCSSLIKACVSGSPWACQRPCVSSKCRNETAR